MNVAVNLFIAVLAMVLLLVAVATLGGIGTVELAIWCVAFVVVMVVVARRSRRQTSS